MTDTRRLPAPPTDRLPAPVSDHWDWPRQAACRGMDSDVFSAHEEARAPRAMTHTIRSATTTINSSRTPTRTGHKNG